MKNIRFYIILTCLLVSWKQYAQIEVRDEKLVALRAAQLVLIAAAAGLRTDLSISLDRLTVQEENYQRKIAAGANLKSTQIYLSMEALNLSVGREIQKLERQIRRIERIPRVLRHGIKDIKSAVAKEKRYRNAISQNILLTAGQTALAGGAGYNYTVWLKRHVQLRRIRARVQLLQYQLNNSGTINRIFIQ